MEYSKIVKKECPMCGKTYFVKLTEVEYDQYKNIYCIRKLDSECTSKHKSNSKGIFENWVLSRMSGIIVW